MRKPVHFLVFILLLSCKSPEKLLQKGDYDQLIDKGIKKELKGKADNADRELIDKAYRLANERDQNRINFLVQENKAENWDEIYRRYSSLSYRQDKLRKIVPFSVNGKRVNYDFVDYTEKIVEAKTEAARYYYNRAEKNVQLNTKEGFRRAYADYIKARDYRADDFPGIEMKIEEARRNGISRVLIEFDNRMRFRVPGKFFDELDNINTSRLNSQWVEYYLVPLDRNIHYDYYITVVLTQALLTPQEIETNEYMRRKKVRDGFEYVLDDRGNVMKDSLGNDMKVPKYRHLSATVIETRQYKSATVKGEIEFISINPDKMLKSEPIAATSIFEHISGKAVGAREALEPEDLELIKIDEVPFPRDVSMIMDCAPILRDAISDAIHDNRNVIY